MQSLNRQIVACNRCSRLRGHCRKVAEEKRAAFRDQAYWGRPVPNFAATPVRSAKLLIVGLAPAAHGANRTGRMFTGDRSGDFLYRAMYATKLASQPTSTATNDGLKLHDTVITAAVHCAPPGNRPTGSEIANCEPFLDATFGQLPRLLAVLCLGRLATDVALRLYQRRGWIEKLSRYRFAHGAQHSIDGAPTLFYCYHPSQQNTFTGRLTAPMLEQVLRQVVREIGNP